MRDPFFLPPIPALTDAVRPWADRAELPLAAVHVHEILASALFYTFIQIVVSPWLSNLWLPTFYPRHSRTKKANWDIHVVSFVQSIIISSVAVWVIIFDDERKLIGQHWQTRAWAYTGAGGLAQSLFVGYFLWDLVVTVLYFDIFGIGLLMHAVSALLVYGCGFRPFLNYWGPVFILYELSTPFLNIHWFLDKLNMTGSKAQLVNGALLLATFFLCRLVWGTYSSILLYCDIWRSWRAPAHPQALEIAETLGIAALFPREPAPVPMWIALANVLSNFVLTFLNWHWFFKMIVAVRKRFDSPPPPKAEREKGGDGADLSRGESTGKAHVKTEDLRRRRYSIEQVVQEFQPDSEELRAGTIQ